MLIHGSLNKANKIFKFHSVEFSFLIEGGRKEKSLSLNSVSPVENADSWLSQEDKKLNGKSVVYLPNINLRLEQMWWVRNILISFMR